jgi:hypothetical protein
MSELADKLQAIRFLVLAARNNAWIAVEGHEDIDNEDMMHSTYAVLDAAMEKLAALETVAER